MTTDAEWVLAGLDDEQRAAVLAPRGPVCILAGAGTGKTRTITHRIAFRVLDSQVPAGQLLAVTFTARAAGEMRGRLRELGIAGAQALTFHAAALRQLRYFWPRIAGRDEPPKLLERKAQLVAQALSRAGQRTDRATVRDATAEIEWAKARLVTPEAFAAAAASAGRDLPLPGELLGGVYRSYEQAKGRSGLIDFDDLLLIMAAAMDEHRDVAEEVRARYRSFVVDEYQDVNPLQQRLLTGWLGDRDDLTVVGDASQTIYTFNGASPEYLLRFAERHPGATVVRLERDYRSTPQVVALANVVIAAAGGDLTRLRLRLVGQRAAGPEPELAGHDDEPAEAAAVSARCRELIDAGTAAAEISVLFRTNAQSEVYEQALAAREVPYVVRGAERFFDRPEVRRAMVLLRGATHGEQSADPLVDTVTAVLSAAGYQPGVPPPGGAAREQWEALAALIALARDLAAAHPEADLAQFAEELRERAQVQHAPTVQGVTLASLHSAKGLEWDVVFLVGLFDGMVPISYASTPDQVEEERRLLYVGVTRARERVLLSWSTARTPGTRSRRQPSRFLDGVLTHRTGPTGPPPRTSRRSRSGPPTCRVCGTVLFDATQRKLRRCGSCPGDVDEELFERLRVWRLTVAGEQKVPAYVVFTDATLIAIAESRPASSAQLGEMPGVGPAKIARYAEDVLGLIAARAAGAPRPA